VGERSEQVTKGERLKKHYRNAITIFQKKLPQFIHPAYNNSMNTKFDWIKIAGDSAGSVRDETRSKYFPQNPLRQFVIRGFLEKLGGVLQTFEWQSLLDVGCGEGFVDYFIMENFTGSTITGVDSDQHAIEVAKNINPKVSYIKTNADTLDFADSSFDAVICIEVLEHIEDYEKVISELARISKGPVIISVPWFPMYQVTNFLIGKNWSRLGEHPDHIHQFTPGKLKATISKTLGKEARIICSYPWLIAVVD
jgi:SAM-dependent methyltransferase